MKKRGGFTLIEVAIFLAVTGVLFVSVTVGVQNSIYQQRYNDSVQNFIELWRNIYAGVANVQNIWSSNGTSNEAIYGKLVAFGYGPNGKKQNNDAGEGQKITVFNVIAKVDERTDVNTSSTIDTLNSLGMRVELSEGNDIGLIESYAMKWGAQVEGECSKENEKCKPFEGLVLVVRDPDSGVIKTYYAGADSGNLDKLSEFKFEEQQIDFCINPDPGVKNTLRRDVRIKELASNASAVMVLGDEEGEACQIK